MPKASARRIEERFKPSIFDRLAQSKEDKKRPGHLKVVEPPREELPATPPILQQFVGMPMTQQTMNTLYNTISYYANSAIIRGTEPIQYTATAITSNTNTYITGQRLMNGQAIWREWTTAGTTTCNDVWCTPISRYTNEWNQWNIFQDAPHRMSRLQSGRVQVIETEEQKKARAEQDARWQRERDEYTRRQVEERKLQEEAKGRAMELLKACLTKEQRGSLEANKFFYVMAKSGRRYRIDEGIAGNVRVVDKDNRVIERLCVHPYDVPAGDAMLAQKLLIETAEDLFRQHANITLNDGRVIPCAPGLLDGEKLAKVIPIRAAA